MANDTKATPSSTNGPASRRKPKSGKAKHSAPGNLPPKPKIETTRDFYFDDLPKTLFPLFTNRFLVERGEQEIQEYVKKCLDGNEKAYAFSPQKRVYASKAGGYLRRTIKLDAVAEYYVYDVVFRNRKLFRKPHVKTRTHYGYRFESGLPIAATNAYKGFKGGLAEYSREYKHFRGVDVATYFNGLYHHDIVRFFHELGASTEDADGLGQLLREIAAGRSIDCLPQGLYPTKMIGSEFLRFIDNYHDLRSDQVIRFMDDIYFFSDDEGAIDNDFQTIQRLLGDKGLSINPRKTSVDSAEHAAIDKQIDRVKRELLKRRRIEITTGYTDDGGEVVRQKLIRKPLSKAEMKYIEGVLEKPDIEEEDAELLLTIMRGHADRVERRLPYIIETYPHLAKNLHAFFSEIDPEAVAELILAHAKKQDRLSEDQLFWFGASVSDQLMGTTKSSALISVLLNHRSATLITKAKILETGDLRYGLQDLRDEILSNGQSDWLGWSAAVGSRTLKPGSRNHKLKYWAKSSNMNHVVATILLKQ